MAEDTYGYSDWTEEKPEPPEGEVIKEPGIGIHPIVLFAVFILTVFIHSC